MPETVPYVIIHIQLDTYDFSVIPKLELGKRYYFVFWWLKIPLGDLYIYEADHANFSNKLLDSIIPTLKKYNDKDEEINGIIAAYKNSDILKFSTLIENIIAPYLALEIPNNVDISVVVCTRNRSESLKICLDSLNNQICMPSEILVVDNAPSDDRTIGVVKQFNNVHYHRENRPGLSIARNLGVKLAKYSIIAFTDDDVAVDNTWIYRIWETFISEDIEAMTGLVITSSLETESQQIFEKHWGFNKGYKDIYFDLNYFYKKNNVPKVWDIGAGANMAFRKDAIKRVNYFDERLGAGASGCSEDSEIWFRILLRGLKIHYNPRAIVFHEHRKELKQLHKQLFAYMRGHCASVFIQHDQNKQVGYKKYLYYEIPRYYIFLILAGFPNYDFRYQTLWSEIRGLISGVRFYNKNKKKPTLTL